MAKIKKLPLHEAQKIAAGEVVERPANVVKELVENSIDAQATQIFVHLEDGGKKLIRVEDNGCGMSEQDAKLCFCQHATSKITTVEDLDSIATFGFRGEALASIAAVSNVTLITKEKNTENLTGTKLKLNAGKIIKQETVSATPGTDIIIENIFFNLPARQKFLKKKETESRQITQLLHAFCLAYPNIHFKFFNQKREQINCPQTKTRQARIAQVWDHAFSEQMITLCSSETKQAVSISGLISNHQYFRYDRGQIFFFVNNRWIKNFDLSRALLRGYTNVLPPARYPAAAIFIEVDPQKIDVNIHPRKEEVQFLNPRTITSLLQEAVKTTLENHLSSQLKKTVNISSQKNFSDQAPFESQPFSRKPIENFSFSKQLQQPQAFTFQNNPLPIETKQKKILESNLQATPEVESLYNIIGQYKKTYILIEKEDGLFLIDQHAAHERILYQQLCGRFKNTATVKLMFPEIITLNEEDMETVAPHLEIFTKNNIQIEPFGQNQLVVHATPVHIKNIKMDELVKEVAGWVREHDQLEKDQFFKAINEKMHAQMACKAAIKAGDTLTMQQMEKLLQDLDQTENRLTCPHGRPTGWLLSLYEIEKKFKRKL